MMLGNIIAISATVLYSCARLYVTNGTDIFYTDDNGATWQQLPTDTLLLGDRQTGSLFSGDDDDDWRSESAV